MRRARIWFLLLLFIAGLATRVPQLGAAGLSEDEMDKLAAASRYQHGDFTFDGEHPALLKIVITALLETRDIWNRAARRLGAPAISAEAAIRLPSAVAGAATAVVLFALVEIFFGALPAACAAWLWIFDLNAIAVNRIAKEDSFAVLFLLVAAWLFEQGKAAGRTDGLRARPWFDAAAVSFGCMVASKYLPYLFGIHVLYFRLADPYPGRNSVQKIRYLAIMGAAFAAANFPIFLPANWQTILGFVSERAIQHSGYFFQDRLWINAMSATPHGLPPWFYAAEFLTKIPLPVLVVIAAGLVVVARQAPSRGRTFVLIFAILTFVPYSIIATKFLRYMLPTLAIADIAGGVGLAWLIDAVRPAAGRVRAYAAFGAAAAILLAPAIAWSQARPLVGLYRNVIGASLAPNRLWFPPDELYDAGVREAMARVAAAAPRDATVVTEAPSVAGYYARAYGRPDLRVIRPTPNAPAHSWWLVQDGRLYFENLVEVADVRHAGAPAFEIDVRGFRAVEAYLR